MKSQFLFSQLIKNTAQTVNTAQNKKIYKQCQENRTFTYFFQNYFSFTLQTGSFFRFSYSDNI